MKKLVISLAMAACLVGSADARCVKWWKYNNCGENADNLHYSLTKCGEQATLDKCGQAGCPVFRSYVNVNGDSVSAKSDEESVKYLGKLAADGDKLKTIHAKCASYYTQVGEVQPVQPELKAVPSSSGLLGKRASSGAPVPAQQPSSGGLLGRQPTVVPQ